MAGELFFDPEKQELKNSKIVVEIGSSRNPAYEKLGKDNEWFRQEIANSNYICVDLFNESFESNQIHSDGQARVVNDLFDNIKINKIYANGQKMPLADLSADLVVMADVLSFRVSPSKTLLNRTQVLDLGSREDISTPAYNAQQMELLIEEAYRILKFGGKLVVANFYRHIEPEATDYIIEGLKNDSRFSLSIQESVSHGQTREVLILTKRLVK